MGNKQLGKDVERKSKEAIIPYFPRSEISNIFDAKADDGSPLSAIDYLKG